MAKWIRVNFSGSIVHVVGAALYPLLVADMANRKCPIMDRVKEYGAAHAAALDRDYGPNPSPIDKWGIDIGGAMHVNRPVEVFDVGLLELCIPSEDVAAMLATVKALERRNFEGWRPLRSDGNQQGYKTPYYKLHGNLQAMVLAPSQYSSLRSQLVTRAAGAERRAREFNDKLVERRQAP